MIPYVNAAVHGTPEQLYVSVWATRDTGEHIGRFVPIPSEPMDDGGVSYSLSDVRRALRRYMGDEPEWKWLTECAEQLLGCSHWAATC